MMHLVRKLWRNDDGPGTGDIPEREIREHSNDVVVSPIALINRGAKQFSSRSLVLTPGYVSYGLVGAFRGPNQSVVPSLSSNYIDTFTASEHSGTPRSRSVRPRFWPERPPRSPVLARDQTEQSGSKSYVSGPLKIIAKPYG